MFYNTTIIDELLDERENFSNTFIEENENENATFNNMIEENENENINFIEENVNLNNFIEENENATFNTLSEENVNLNNFIKENKNFNLNTLEILINKMMTQRDEKIQKLKNTCCICLNKESTYIYINCGHYCLCSKCKHRYNNNSCPKCRIIGTSIKVFK